MLKAKRVAHSRHTGKENLQEASVAFPNHPPAGAMGE